MPYWGCKSRDSTTRWSGMCSYSPRTRASSFSFSSFSSPRPASVHPGKRPPRGPPRSMSRAPDGASQDQRREPEHRTGQRPWDLRGLAVTPGVGRGTHNDVHLAPQAAIGKRLFLLDVRYPTEASAFQPAGHRLTTPDAPHAVSPRIWLELHPHTSQSCLHRPGASDGIACGRIVPPSVRRTLTAAPSRTRPDPGTTR